MWSSVEIISHSKLADKYGQFVSYKIATKQQGVSAAKHVERRYSDFVWLSTELSKLFPGSILPPLPGKQTMGRFSPDFIEARRRALERFLARVVSLPEIVNAINNNAVPATLTVFLEGDEVDLVRAKEEAKAKANNAAKITSASMAAWLEGTVNTITVGKMELEKSAADMKVEEISLYLSLFEKHISHAAKHCEALIKRNKELSHAYFECAQSVSALRQTETDALGTSLAHFGSTLETASSLTSAHSEGESVKFLEPLEDYVRVVACIRTAIQQRADKKALYASALADVEAKGAAQRKLVGVAGKEAQLQAKEEALQAAQEAAESAKAEFERVTERLLNEFELFKLHKANDIQQCIVEFVKLQIEYSKKYESLWGDALPKLVSCAASAPSAPSLAVSEASLDSSEAAYSPAIAYKSDNNSNGNINGSNYNSINSSCAVPFRESFSDFHEESVEV